MGGVGSGTPVSREAVIEALARIEAGQSRRSVAKEIGVCRDTLAKYAKDPLYRRTTRRCPVCGFVVRWPCRLCSDVMQEAAGKRGKQLRRAGRRKQLG